MVVFKWVVTYTACPLGKLTRIVKHTFDATKIRISEQTTK